MVHFPACHIYLPQKCHCFVNPTIVLTHWNRGKCDCEPKKFTADIPQNGRLFFKTESPFKVISVFCSIVHSSSPESSLSEEQNKKTHLTRVTFYWLKPQTSNFRLVEEVCPSSHNKDTTFHGASDSNEWSLHPSQHPTPRAKSHRIDPDEWVGKKKLWHHRGCIYTYIIYIYTPEN